MSPPFPVPPLPLSAQKWPENFPFLPMSLPKEEFVKVGSYQLIPQKRVSASSPSTHHCQKAKQIRINFIILSSVLKTTTEKQQKLQHALYHLSLPTLSPTDTSVLVLQLPSLSLREVEALDKYVNDFPRKHKGKNWNEKPGRLIPNPMLFSVCLEFTRFHLGFQLASPKPSKASGPSQVTSTVDVASITCRVKQ